ncbi:MAG: hypothetical protein GTO02_00710 [Candidatus Dadabacteria bacterium]|nr:hypothetical protein [Candidatus Dadabacteria bacterium]
MVLEKMIDQKILDQEAGKRGIVVSEAELDATIGELKKRFNINEENIESELKKQNLTLEEFREQWRYQLLSKKLLDTNLKGKIAVSEDEIVDYYRENYGGGEEIEYESQVRISHILIPLDEENALEKSTEIANMAKSGKDFAGLAKEYSKDSLSASKGGDLGYFNKGDLVVELEQAIEQTEIGGITDPIITSGGYHIVKVTDRKKSDTASVGNYRDEIKQTLYNKKLEEFLKNWISDLKDDSYIEIKI